MFSVSYGLGENWRNISESNKLSHYKLGTEQSPQSVYYAQKVINLLRTSR